jgi:ABC-type glycerol-3-phosphate transport system substrate-binding protein
MKLRSALLLAVLVLPAAGLLVFGPRGRHVVPPDRIVVRYWEKWSGVEGAAMQRLVDAFNNGLGAERGVWVDYTAISNVDQRTLIATAGGDPPDLAGLYDHVVAQFADQGALLPLDELAAEYGIDGAAFKPIWWEIGRYKGQLFALPSAPYTIALFYNRRLFREAGLDPDAPPQSIEELTDFAKRLTRYDANGRISQMGFTTSPAMLGWWHWVWPFFFGARPWDGERFSIDTPEGRAAYAWLARTRADVGVGQALTFEASALAIESAQNPFLSGRLAMVFQGPWMATWARTYAPELDYGVARFPSAEADRQHVFASADVFVIPRGAKHPREAMLFLSYVLRQDVMEELCRAHGKVSPFRAPSSEFFANHTNPHIRTFDALAASPDVFGYPKMPTWSQASSAMLTLLDTVLRAKDSPADAVAAAQRRIDAIVQEYDAMQRLRYGDAGPAGGTAGLSSAGAERP